jgi:hypothetical protein
MQKNLSKILIFIINGLLMAITFLVIKDQDRKNLAIKTDTNSTINSINSNILDSQNAISTNRENKLRELNNTPQEQKNQQTITTKTITDTAPTITVTPAPPKIKKASRTTKSS